VFDPEEEYSPEVIEWSQDDAREWQRAMNSTRPVITIELVNEPGQPAWWRAAFRDHHGGGPDPVAALDNLLKCITTSVLVQASSSPLCNQE
jgi:hypothetical protein